MNKKILEFLYLNIILGVLYFLTGKISLTLLSGNEIINIGVFMPEGISLAFALYYGKKILPGIFFGQFFLAYSTSVVLCPSLIIAIINTSEAFIAIYLFKKLGLSKDLKHYKDIMGLFGIIIFIIQPFSALLSNLTLFFYHEIVEKDFLYLMFSWWFGNIMGQLLMTPFLLLLFKNYKKEELPSYILYGLLFGSYLYVMEIVINIHNATMMLTFSITGVILIIANKNILYGTYFSFIAALIASYAIYIGDNKIFSGGSLSDNIINYNLYILAHIVLTWILGILFEERKYYESILNEKIGQEVAKNKEQQLLMLQQNRLAQMGEMISMIAHQWRQPLNNLYLVNQLVVSKYNKGKLNDSSIEYFKLNSKKQIDQMSKTIDDFRNFFKTEKVKEEFVVNEVIENTLGMIQDIYASNDISIEYQKEKKYVAVGFPNTLAQALLNIINNAKDALLDSDVENKKVEIRLSYKEELIFIDIQDNAGGIPENIIEKIFDPYFSTKQDKNGTGLGLYMSKMIINEQGNANISVKNIPSFGANFTISIKGEVYAGK